MQRSLILDEGSLAPGFASIPNPGLDKVGVFGMAGRGSDYNECLVEVLT